MNDQEARKRILDMLAAGRITVDAATDLLKAIGAPGQVAEASAPTAKPRGSARVLRIAVDAPPNGDDSGAKVRVNIPLALAKYAGRFLPAEATTELSQKGIDLAQLLKDLSDDMPDGRLIDIEADDPANGGKTTVVVEVV